MAQLAQFLVPVGRVIFVRHGVRIRQEIYQSEVFMRRVMSVFTAVLAAGFALTIVATPAAAAQGSVTVFESEAIPVVDYPNPQGCYKLPLLSHVLVNHMASEVRVYLDPLCLGPSLTVPPGYGSHVAIGSGSFSV
jgi:hypothetical protein